MEIIPNRAIIAFICIILCCIGFITWSFFIQKKQSLIHKLYIALFIAIAIWSGAMLGIRFADPSDIAMLFFWDSVSNIGCALAPVIMLHIALVFVGNREEIPRKWLLLWILPVITIIVTVTNPVHHLHYKVFSVIRSEIVFGPYIIINGIYNYIYALSAAIILVKFAAKTHSRLYLMQTIMLTLGDITPLVINIIATLGVRDISIAATPLGFSVTLICTYVAVYQLHLLDLKPIATQHVLDWISDGYIILNDKGLVVSNNRPFREVFSTLYGITTNKYLKDCVNEKDVVSKTAVYNLLSAIQSCEESHAAIAYEQAVNIPSKDGKSARKQYYMADITPLYINKKLSGFIVIFKDITQIKKSMQQVHDGKARLMEQERLAFLGQMVGGLAHNLKTPIMSISGCTVAINSLISEAESSLLDTEVTTEDYHEIYGEVNGWLEKISESCAYMSDIITAIKGQAANVSTSLEMVFTVAELIKRSSLLMRHELLSSGCRLIFENDVDKSQVTLTGDINNLIQVLNNLISNAIDAEKLTGGDKIYIGLETDETNLSVYVKDTGPGVDERVAGRLFKEMITSKGAKGTGLGLYISDAVVRGKFGGFMWVRENPDGGSIFGFSIPIEPIIKEKENDKGVTAK